MYVIKVMGPVTGEPFSGAGEWLKFFDPDLHDGRGEVITTSEVVDALLFATRESAIEFIFQESRVRPLREDGMPNRPLTSLSLVVGQVS